jgi:hypothetical protein
MKIKNICAILVMPNLAYAAPSALIEEKTHGVADMFLSYGLYMYLV